MKTRRTRWSPGAILGCLWLLGVGLGPVGSAGQSALPAGVGTSGGKAPAGAGSEEVQPSAAVLEARLAEARAQLAAWVETGATNVPVGISMQDSAMRRAALRRLVLLYEQHLMNAESLRKVLLRKADLSRELQTWSRFAEPPPYSILLTDGLRGELQSVRQGMGDAEASVALVGRLIEENRQDLARAEEKIRGLNEQLESVKDPLAAARFSWQREMERLRSQVAAATIAALDFEQMMVRETLALDRLQVELLERKLAVAEAGDAFTEADLGKVYRQAEQLRLQLEQELAQAEVERAAALDALAAARAEAERGEGGQTGEGALAAGWLAAREAQLDAADAAIQALRLMLEGVGVERTMWEMRFAASNSRSLDVLRDSERRLRAYTDRLNLWLELGQRQLHATGAQQQLQEAQENSLPADSPLLAAVREKGAALQARERMVRRFVRAVEGHQRLSERWAESLEAAAKDLPFTGRVRNLVSDVGSLVDRVWNFEVFSAEDTVVVDGQKVVTVRGVTVRKLALAALILVGGIWMTGLVLRLLGPILTRRFKLDPNYANLIHSWLRALLIACLVILSLVSVKIPLTVFAFAGGALAIGLGFGMQTVLKNFVSGLILLFERPFRVGDVLDVAGQKGVVTSIGLRASVFSMPDGTETLIPNSSLLEDAVTNSTYSNNNVRFTIKVGVAYGSDPRRVIQLMHEVAERHGLVDKDPKPQVLFTEFGESTLDFELRFFLDITRASAAQVCSDLRLMIAAAFAEHHIVVDYPQRDLHLHAARPLPVQLVASGSESAAAAGSPAVR